MMYFIVTEKDGKVSKVAQKNEEEACIGFFRKVSEVLSNRDKKDTVTINNYNCDFGNGYRMWIEKVNQTGMNML